MDQTGINQNMFKTRMIQLPATAAIKYVAAGHFFPGGLLAGGLLAGGIFVRGCFCPGGLSSGGTFVRGAYARSPQVQCVLAYTYRLGFLCLAS